MVANITTAAAEEGLLQSGGMTRGEEISIVCVVLISAVFVSLGFFCKSRKSQREAKGLGRSGEADLESLEVLVDKDIEQERFMTTSCLKLYFNQPWTEEPGNDVIVKELSSNEEWMEGRTFPRGEQRKGCVFRMTLALWRFCFAKKTADARFCFILCAIMGLEPALTTELKALMVGQIKKILDPVFVENKDAYLVFLAYGAAMHLVSLLKDRLFFRFERDVPGASVRYELRQRLQRQFLELKADSAREWPAGRCAALLTYDVDTMVKKSWLTAFRIVEHAVTVNTLAAILIYNCASLGLVLVCATFAVILFAAAYGDVKVRRPNLFDLQARKRRSLHNYLTISTLQIAGSREVHRDLQEPAELDSEANELQESTESESEVAKSTVFCGKAAMLYRKRSFHYFFARLASVTSSHEMATVAQMAVMAILGLEAFRMRISVTGAVAVITSAQSLAKEVDTSVGLWLNLNEGFPSLLGIADVLNFAFQRPSPSGPSPEERNSPSGASLGEQRSPSCASLEADVLNLAFQRPSPSGASPEERNYSSGASLEEQRSPSCASLEEV